MPEVIHPGPELVQHQNIFLRFLVRNFCQKFYFSKLFKVLKKYFWNINSFMHFQVGPEVVQGGPDLVQPGILGWTRSGPGWTRTGPTLKYFFEIYDRDFLPK